MHRLFLLTLTFTLTIIGFNATAQVVTDRKQEKTEAVLEVLLAREQANALIDALVNSKRDQHVETDQRKSVWTADSDNQNIKLIDHVAPDHHKTYTIRRHYIRGPRGGCYYINGNGNKTYVDRSMCD